MIHSVRAADDQHEDAAAAVNALTGGPARGPMGDLRAATAMLTRLPIPGTPVAGTGVRAFALVGALLGLATFLPLVALGASMPTVSAILAVAMLVLLSGGVHLDGLADTFDALVAVGPDASERARRDPAVGAAGAMALVLVLGLDAAVLADLVAKQGAVIAGLACIVAGSMSRLVPAVVARLARSAAADDGLGAWFVRRTSSGDVAIVVVTGLIVALASAVASGRWELAAGGVIGGIATLGVGLGLVRLRGRLDGDLFGASVEIGFVLTLLVTAVLAGWPGV
jgi:adenosylcobinamide-GDP ribazoletransferase